MKRGDFGRILSELLALVRSFTKNEVGDERID